VNVSSSNDISNKNKMGLCATLCEIDEIGIERTKENIDRFDSSMIKGSVSFVQNFDGILFLLNKVVKREKGRLLDEIFYQKDYIGEAINFDEEEYDYMNDSFMWEKNKKDPKLQPDPIGYLTKDKVMEIERILKKINSDLYIGEYNSKEFNSAGVYPEVWHDDESENKVFNRRCLLTGLKELKIFFEKVARNNNCIICFIS